MLNDLIVLIGPTDLLSHLNAWAVQDDEVLEFGDTDEAKAFQTIVAKRPSIVLLELGFATSPRGSAFINRVRRHSDVGHTRILVGTHGGDRRRLYSLSDEIVVPSPRTVCEEHEPDTPSGAQATRFVMTIGIMIQLNGDPATVVNMSRTGAQVLSSRALRPSQRARVLIKTEPTPIRCEATIVWVKLELNEGEDGSYHRAGLEFLGADGDAIEEYCLAHRRATP